VLENSKAFCGCGEPSAAFGEYRIRIHQAAQTFIGEGRIGVASGDSGKLRASENCGWLVIAARRRFCCAQKGPITNICQFLGNR
jgi:hypothetical protein